MNETFAETPLVVVFDDRSASGAIFTRAVAGKMLTFKLAEQTETALLITDQETGTKWHGLSGVALEGQLAGQRLTAIPATPSFCLAGRIISPIRQSTANRIVGQRRLQSGTLDLPTGPSALEVSVCPRMMSSRSVKRS